MWSAHDKKLNRTVAVKTPHSAQSDAERDRFAREAKNAAQVQHSKVIAVYDTLDDPADFWLVMEYLPSESMDRLLAEEGPMSPQRAARIGMQVASGLVAAHAKDILHRDVKPGNILVADGDLAKLGDFGIALWRDETVTDQGKISGTAAYVAPEIANGRTPTKASDVFSLGATLYEAVEGAPPFGAGDPDVILARALRSRVPEPQRAGSLTPVLLEMLASRPGRRPTAEQVYQRLREAAGTWEPPAEEPPPKMPFWRRRGYQLVAAAVVLVVFAALAAIELVPRVSANRADPIGDPGTADPCGLVDQNALNRFGSTSLDPYFGNFNRCDVLVDVNGEKPVDVRYELDNADPPHAVRPGTFTVERDPLDGDSCNRTVPVSNDHDVVITAKDNKDADLCAMADAATNSAIATLRRGPLPRRRPFDPSSWANLNACGLVDGKALAEIPGVDATHPTIGLGNWDCRWESTINSTGLHVVFDQGQPPTGEDGTPIQLPGHAAFLQVDDYQDRSCDVRVVGRPFSDLNGQRAVEMLVVIVYGSDQGQSYCSMATDFARAALARLPA